MKVPCSFLTIRLIPILGFVLLLSSCAPTTSLAPSGALKEQLRIIKQQQQEQETQLLQLQQQFSQLHQQLVAEKMITAQIQDNIESPQQLEPMEAPVIAFPAPQNQVIPNQEAVTIAASASSYLTAFSNLAAGRQAVAETGFQEFLRDFPDHQYAPNARYWLASAQLSQGKTNLAIGNLQIIIADPKAQNKAPAALKQLALIYRQQGSQMQADDVLEQLRNRYPESQEAQHFYRSEEPTN